MTTAFARGTGLGSDEWAAREQLLRRFEDAWRHGPRPSIEDYLPAGRHDRRTVLLELVHTELEYRLKAGEPARVEEYLDRFPELKSDPEAELDLINAELDLRRYREPALAMLEYRERFPQYRPELVSTWRGMHHAGGATPQRRTCPQCREPLDAPVESSSQAVACPACGAAIGPDHDDSMTRSSRPSRIGKYEPLEELGRGTFGVVYRARDLELDRIVALKVPRAGGLATPEEVDRFLREARSAAQLEHPHIVPVHDSGRAGETCYLACGFVPGTTLARRMAAGRLPFREAAAMAARVAEALHYAHTRGVVHRDVKPANILLDRQGQPHLTDFGLARREAGEVTLTLDGEPLGTPAYMPPEQARGQAHRVDGRGDLYSLGVVLYQLLTGELPFRGDAVMIRKQVLEDEPQPPRRLNGRIPRDLETICLKCLEKDPARRHASAAAMAEDLRRFLDGVPILARPVGRIARLGRWARRNPWPSAFLVAMVLGVIVSTWQAIRATGAERAATRAAADAQRSEARALRAKSQANATLDFFRDKVLAAARPKDQEGGLGIDATIRAAVDAAEPSIDEAFADEPVVEASIRATLGETYRYLGAPERAIRQDECALALRRRFLGPDQLATLISMNNLALAYREAGRFDEAIALHEEDLKHSTALFGPDHRATLISMNNLALAYREAGRFDDAIALHQEELERQRARHGPHHPEVLSSLGNLALAFQAAGRLDDALPLFEVTLKGRQARFGPDHPDTLNSLYNLGSAYLVAGRLAEALPRLEAARERQLARLGPDHRDTMITTGDLAVGYLRTGRRADALRLLEETVKRRQAGLGLAHPDTMNAMSHLARAYLPDRPAQAEPLLRQALAIRQVKTPDDWQTFEARSLLGGSLLRQQKYREAEPLLLEGYDGMKAREARILPMGKGRLAEAGARIIALYEAMGRKDKAESWRKAVPQSPAGIEPGP